MSFWSFTERDDHNTATKHSFPSIPSKPSTPLKSSRNTNNENMFDDSRLFGVEVKMLREMMDQLESQLKDRNKEVNTLRQKLLQSSSAPSLQIKSQMSRMTDIINEQLAKIKELQLTNESLQRERSHGRQKKNVELNTMQERIQNLESIKHDFSCTIETLKNENRQGQDKIKSLSKQLKEQKVKKASGRDQSATLSTLVTYLSTYLKDNNDTDNEPISLDKIQIETKISKRSILDLCTILSKLNVIQFINSNTIRIGQTIASDAELIQANTLMQQEIIRLRQETQSALGIIDIATKLQIQNSTLKEQNDQLNKELQQLRMDTVAALSFINALKGEDIKKPTSSNNVPPVKTKKVIDKKEKKENNTSASIDSDFVFNFS